jgi:hypothetical protein
VRGAEVSALRREADGALTLRVVNRTPGDAELTVARDGAELPGRVVDLVGTDLGVFDGRRALRPWELLTLRLADV